jgi:hypothetical protein
MIAVGIGRAVPTATIGIAYADCRITVFLFFGVFLYLYLFVIMAELC